MERLLAGELPTVLGVDFDPRADGGELDGLRFRSQRRLEAA